MTDEEILKRVYAAFNGRDIPGVLAFMHKDVVWPNGMEGGVVHGHEGVREYWTRQWKVVDPQVEPKAFQRDADGRTTVSVYQVVKGMGGELLLDRMVEHVYRIEDGLIRVMEIREVDIPVGS